MKLLIDVGNTRTKFGWLSPSGERESSPLALTAEQLADTLPSWLSTLPTPNAVLGTSVASPDVQHTLDHLLHQQTGLRVQWQTAQIQTLGLQNGYQQPHRLGADRWLALVGLWAHPRHTQARQTAAVQILATFGTATTIDTLTPSGEFPGGLILPGIALMRSSLVSGTAQLPTSTGPAMDWPNHTHAAIQTGLLAAQWGAVRRQVELAQRQFPTAPVRLCVTGGAWAEIAEFAQSEMQNTSSPTPEIVDNPVLDGLAALAASLGH